MTRLATQAIDMAEKASSLLEDQHIDLVALGMSWFPEQAGNGLDRVYYELVRNLGAVGVSVRGLVAGSARVAESGEGAVCAFASDRDPLVTRLRGVRRAMRAMLAEGVPDVVAAHFALYALPVLDMVRGPLVVHFHGPWSEESAVEGSSFTATRIKRMVESAVYRRADRFVVLSSAFRDVLVRTHGVDEARVCIVPGGVDVERFDTGITPGEARRLLGWPAERPIVLAVRRLAQRMGLEGLIDAAAMLRRENPDVLILIAGRGPLEQSLRTHIEAAGLQDSVRLLGFVADDLLPTAYRAADLSVVPTVALEGFGLTTIESLAAGTPVLVTPRGGLPEAVAGLDPQLVCDDATPLAIADRIASVLRGDLQLPTSDACQAYARDNFAWDSVARRVAEVYREVVR